jgi:hypothetical protein
MLGPLKICLSTILMALVFAGCGRSQLGDGGDGGLPDSSPPPACEVSADCDDGNPCNGSERCIEGTCRQGSPVVCDDGVDCTADTCDETTGECYSLADHTRCELGATCDVEEGCRRRACGDASECDDGQFCNGSEFCIDGSCEPGAPPRCDDGLDCTDDRCDAASNDCLHAANDALCDDGRYCNGVESCDAEVGCRPGRPVSCDDGDDCTLDACDETLGRCTSQPADADRDGYPSCACAGPPCDCDDTDVTVNPGMTEQCRDLRDNDCDRLIDCDDEDDCRDDPRCRDVPCETHGDCDDGSLCNGAERCVDGRCGPGAPLDCDDGVDCTIDGCLEELGGCISDPEDGLCAPGERCDPVFGCVGGVCISDDECDNGLFCDGVEACDRATGLCGTGRPVECADDVDCTDDRCDEALDRCAAIPRNALCDDGLFCDGEETCDPRRGCISGPDPCGSDDPCLIGFCIEDMGCELIARDDDGDSFPPEACGGRDCDDDDPRINPRATEVCGDGDDNDCNGLTDCADGACLGDPDCCEPTGREVCDDGVDNDCDGRTDCEDLRECRRDPACCVPTGPELCDDTIDNDCDGFTDCSDFFDCRRDPSCEDCIPELCWDGEDNDCDDLVDCEDPDCAWFPPCDAPDTERECHNRLDDDLDGDIDCADEDCADDPMCPEPDTCDDPFVIDGDEVTGSTFVLRDDYQPVPDADGCAGGSGPEAVMLLVLDGPALVHLDTFGSEYDTVLYVRAEDCERGPQVACNDDVDGVQSEVLFPTEAGSYYIFVDGFGRMSRGDYVLHIELLPLGAEICDNGRDDDGDGEIDCDDRDCARWPDCLASPERGVAGCTDGRDNDRDGLTDCDDGDDCAVVDFIGECCNGEDDNGNGVVDEFVCACDDGGECGASYCYTETVGACGPSCAMLGGDTFCEWIFPGTSCSRRTNTCVY